MCCFRPTIFKRKDKYEVETIYPKLGEVHLIKDYWNLENLSHELTHALLWVLTIWPLDEKDTPHEELCYMLGRWVDRLYTNLYKVNPNKKWKRVKNDR